MSRRRQQNVQQQARSRLDAMRETAQAFSRHPGRSARLRAIFAALALPLCLAGCMGDGSIEVTGRVVDHKGEPIAGARVRLETPSNMAMLVTTTDTNGGFHLSELASPGRYTLPLVAEAEVFKPARLDIQAQREHRVLVKLAPAESSAESAIVHAPDGSAPSPPQ